MLIFKIFVLILVFFIEINAFSDSLPPPILRFAIEDEPTTFDWHNARPRIDRFLNSFLMRNLLAYSGQDGMNLVCDLCRSYEVSGDGQTLVFELNQAEKWSDGVILEAKHFVDSFNRLLSPKNKFKVAEDFRIVDSVEAIDSYHFKIKLKRSSKFFPHLLTTISTNPIRKEFIHESNPSSFQEHVSKAVVGPYYLAAIEKGKRIVIEANPNFRAPLPVQRVDFVMGNHQDHIQRFKVGKIDVFSGPTVEDLLQVPAHRVQVNPYWATRLLVFNFQRKGLDNLSFRKAVLYALDRQSLPAFLGNGERKVTGLIPPGLKGYRDLALLSADIQRAKQELERTPEMKNKKIKILINNSETGRKVGAWLKEQLSKLELDIELVAKTGREYFQNLEKREFDLAVYTLALATASPLDALRALRTGERNNYGKWSNVVYDELLDQLFDEKNEALLGPKIDQATQILEMQAVGVIPLTYPVRSYLLGSRLDSFTLDSFGDPVLSKIKLKK